jgi:DNA repair protein RadC
MSQNSYEKQGSIRSWAEEDRPREKMLLKGKSALSDAELIAILIGTGTVDLSAVDIAKNMLSRVNNDLSQLAKLTLTDLTSNRGIGEAKAITILAAVELGRRRKEQLPQKRTKITSPEAAYLEMKPYLLDLRHEEFWVILLNQANHIIKPVQVSKGGVAGTIADTKVVFKIAIENMASAIILVHNHPSGSLTPSKADLDLTKQFKEAGDIMALPILDHLIFADDGFFSFKDEGII